MFEAGDWHPDMGLQAFLHLGQGGYIGRGKERADFSKTGVQLLVVLSVLT